MDAADPRFIDSSYFLLSNTMLIVGLILGVCGWLWVCYQSYRLAPLHGLLGLVTGVWAIIYGMGFMEHKHKIAGMTVFIVGFMMAGAGYGLTYAGWLCDVDDECNRPMRAEVLDAEAAGFDIGQLSQEGSSEEEGAAEEGAAEEGAAEEGAAEAGAAEAGAAEAGAAEEGAAEAGAAEAGAAEEGAAEAGAAEAGAEGEAGSTE